MTSIPEWYVDDAGGVVAVREAEQWRSLGEQVVDCDLCYRRCTLLDEQDGWCRYRGNRGGRMTLHAHGVLSRAQRQVLGYAGGIRTVFPGLTAVAIGGVHCTAGCRFCCSGDIVWRPTSLQWLGNRERGVGYSGGWMFVRSMLHPRAVMAMVRQWAAGAVTFAENEPLLSFEYTLDVARLAKAAGLKVVIYTNGFSTPAAVRQLAPYVDAIDLGLKGHLDPSFYAHWMQAPGAADAVKASARTWKAAGVYVMVSNVVATMHQQDDATFCEAAKRCSAWIADELGPHTPLLLGGMHGPLDPARPGLEERLLVHAGEEDTYALRVLRAQEIAQQAGLAYTHLGRLETQIACHNCRGLLVATHAPRSCTWEPCGQFGNGCTCWTHEQHVTDSRCDHCGASVPILTLSVAELARIRAQTAQIADALAPTFHAHRIS